MQKKGDQTCILCGQYLPVVNIILFFLNKQPGPDQVTEQHPAAVRCSAVQKKSYLRGENLDVQTYPYWRQEFF